MLRRDVLKSLAWLFAPLSGLFTSQTQAKVAPAAQPVPSTMLKPEVEPCSSELLAEIFRFTWQDRKVISSQLNQFESDMTLLLSL